MAPFGGPLLVRVGRARYALGREVAGKIFVTGVKGADGSGLHTERAARGRSTSALVVSGRQSQRRQVDPLQPSHRLGRRDRQLPGHDRGPEHRRRHWRGQEVQLVDLPGTYALDPVSEDQWVARHGLLDWRPDVVIAVVDATNLARNLYLVLQLVDLGCRVVIALNLDR